jgi:protein required for attachment to host cells
MRFRIVIANQGEAQFHDSVGPTRKFAAAGRLLNPNGRLHDQDLEADRPGRVFNFAATPGRRRGATPRHGANGERSTHQHVAEKFARRIADDLRRAHAARRFDRLVLVAAPAFLGRLRRTLPANLRACVAATVAKDMIGQEFDAGQFLTSDMHAGRLGFQPAKRATARSIT